jgi:hypothetical protein
MIRKLFLAAGLLALAVASSGLGTPEPAYACPETCKRECLTWYHYCLANPGTTYYGCNFVRYCGSYLSVSQCETYECIL